MSDLRIFSAEELAAEKAWKRIRRRVTIERRAKMIVGSAFGISPAVAGILLLVLR